MKQKETDIKQEAQKQLAGKAKVQAYGGDPRKAIPKK